MEIGRGDRGPNVVYIFQNLLAVEQRQADAEKRIQQLAQRLNPKS